MKKYLFVALIFFALCMIAVGCAGGEEAGDPLKPGNDVQTGAEANVDPETEAGANAGNDAQTNTDADNKTDVDAGDDTEVKKEDKPPVVREPVDVDFTAMSNIMAQAELNNLRTNSAAYIGKTIRVCGSYYSVFLPETNQEYHFISFSYADACCRQGIEFRLTEGNESSDNFPAQYKEIEIVGTVGKYDEWGSTYMYLATEEIVLA